MRTKIPIDVYQYKSFVALLWHTVFRLRLHFTLQRLEKSLSAGRKKPARYSKSLRNGYPPVGDYRTMAHYFYLRLVNQETLKSDVSLIISISSMMWCATLALSSPHLTTYHEDSVRNLVFLINWTDCRQSPPQSHPFTITQQQLRDAPFINISNSGFINDTIVKSTTFWAFKYWPSRSDPAPTVRKHPILLCLLVHEFWRTILKEVSQYNSFFI